MPFDPASVSKMKKVRIAEKKLNEEFVARMLRESSQGIGPPLHFTAGELFRLLEHFRHLASPDTKVSRGPFTVQLHRAFHITEYAIMDRLFHAFDRDNDGLLSCEEYILGMSTFLRGDLEARLPFAFTVYALKREGQISREEMFHLLKTSLSKATMEASEEDPEETTREIVEIVFKKLDVNHDGRIDFDDFSQAVHQDSLLLECLGQCLPSPRDAEKFMESLPE